MRDLSGEVAAVVVVGVALAALFAVTGRRESGPIAVAGGRMFLCAGAALLVAVWRGWSQVSVAAGLTLAFSTSVLVAAVLIALPEAVREVQDR